MGPQKKTTKLNYIKPKTPEFLMKYKTKAFETFVERKSYIEKKNSWKYHKGNSHWSGWNIKT